MRPVLVLTFLAIALAACGGGASAPDAGSGDDEPDAEEMPLDGPPVTPACIVPPAGNPYAAPCQECLVSSALSATASECADDVCNFDPSCCTTGWTERCVELADLRCPDLQCLNAVSFGGIGTLTVGWHDGAAWHGQELVAGGEFGFDMATWGDYDRDGDADLATVSGCAARIYRNDGWDDGEVELTPVFTDAPLPNCVNGGGPFYRGTRARWADLDQDGDLDAAFASDFGVMWARQSASAFTRAGEIVPASAGPVPDFALVDVDADGDLDAFVGREADVGFPPPGLYRQGDTGWTEDPWDGTTGQTLTIAACDLVGDAQPEIVFAGYGGTEAYRIANGVDVDPPVFTPGPGIGFTSGIDFACGQLDDDDHQEIAFLPGDESVVIIDADDDVVWSSVDDLEPDFRTPSDGIAVGDLDGDGDVDLLIATSRNDPGMTDVPFVILRNVSTGGQLAFTPETGIDLSLGNETVRASMLFLKQP